MLRNYPHLSARLPAGTEKILVDLGRVVEHLDKVIKAPEENITSLQHLYSVTLNKVLSALDTMVEGATDETVVPLSVLLYELECNWYRFAMQKAEGTSARSVEAMKQQFHGFDNYDETERSALTKLYGDCEAIHTALQSLFDAVGPNNMQRLPRTVFHISAGKIADHFGEKERDVSGMTTKSLNLAAGETLLFNASKTERHNFLTKVTTANVLKKFGREMLEQAQAGHIDPQTALQQSEAMTNALYAIYKQHGDPMDNSDGFHSTV